MARRLVWVALAVASAYAVFIGGSWFGIYQPGLRLTSVIVAAVALVAWAAVARRDPAWRPRSTLLPAIMACLASLAISTVFSRDLGISLEYLAYAVLLAALYLLLVQLLTRDFFRVRIITLVGALFVLTVGAYLALNVSDWVHWLSVVGRLTIPPLRPEFESLTFGNPSTVLTLVALLAVPLVGAVSWTTRRGIATAIAVLTLVAIVALISGSRAGWLAMAIAGAVALVSAAIDRGTRSRVRTFIGGIGATTGRRAILIGAVGVVVVIIVLLGPAILRRVGGGGEGNRIAFVRIALDLFAQSPLVGTGLGTWVIQRPGMTQPGEVDDYIPHAHNIYAQTLAEQGVIGAIASVVLVLFILRLLIGAIRNPDVTRRRMGWAVLIGLIYFAAHQLLDFYANFPSVLLAAAIPVALLDAAAIQETATGPLADRLRRLSGPPLWAGAAALAASAVLLSAQELPAIDGSRAVDLANGGDWAAADAPARAAAASDPRIASYAFTAGLTAAHAGDPEDSASYFTEVVANNDVPEAWLNLAAEQAEGGESGDTVGSLRAALRMGRQRPGVAIAVGDLALRVGEHDLALDAFTTAVATIPSFLADPWWNQDPTRAAMRVEVTRAAMGATTASTQWEIALMTGDTASARTLAQTPGIDPSTIDFVDAWEGDDAAYQRLTERCLTDSLQLEPLFMCARIEGHRGNPDRANDYRYLANAIVGGTYGAGAEVRVATRPMIGRSSQGGLAIFWGTYTYRRPTPWDMLVPSLVHLTLE